MWFQDFPRISHDHSPISNDFKETLLDYLQHLGVQRAAYYHSFDYSDAAVILISSVPGLCNIFPMSLINIYIGYHKANNLNKYGHMKIREILKNEAILKDPQFKQSELLYQVDVTLATNFPT